MSTPANSNHTHSGQHALVSQIHRTYMQIMGSNDNTAFSLNRFKSMYHSNQPTGAMQICGNQQHLPCNGQTSKDDDLARQVATGVELISPQDTGFPPPVYKLHWQFDLQLLHCSYAAFCCHASTQRLDLCTAQSCDAKEQASSAKNLQHHDCTMIAPAIAGIGSEHQQQSQSKGRDIKDCR